ncbi:MAG TPA: TIGR00366 family protein [Vicinamibacterales bacterium]
MTAKLPISGPVATPPADRGPLDRFEQFARRANAWTERWMPDAFVFALAATLITLAAALAVDPVMRRSPLSLVDAWGSGFWTLIPFTLQMSMMLIGGYVLASSPPIFRVIGRIASWPRTAKGAVCVVALVAMVTSLLNWGFSLIGTAILAREVGRRMPRADYRALASCSVLGICTVWAQGISSSPALQMARASSMPPRLFQIAGEIPLTATIFRWQSAVCVIVEIGVVAGVMWLCAPGDGRGRSAADLGIDLSAGVTATPVKAMRPGEYLEHSPVLLLPIVIIGFTYVVHTLVVRASSLSEALNSIDFNTINLFLLMLGAALHWTPARFLSAFREATPPVWGMLLQFPFYAGIFGVMTGTQLSDAIAHLFVRTSSPTWYPALILSYSTTLGMFVPSGGAKWMIEAPYVIQSAKALGVSSGWMVVSYNLGEAITNFFQPFWMVAILALLGLRARDIMGYTYLAGIVLFPIAILLVTLLRPSL